MTAEVSKFEFSNRPYYFLFSFLFSFFLSYTHQFVLHWFTFFLLRMTFWREAGLLIMVTSSRVQGVFTRCLSTLLSIQSDPVRGQRSHYDYRPPANCGLLQEHGETEQQLLVKALFIQGDLTELCPASYTSASSNWEQTSTTSLWLPVTVWCLRGKCWSVWWCCFLQNVRMETFSLIISSTCNFCIKKLHSSGISCSSYCHGDWSECLCVSLCFYNNMGS